MLRHGALGRGRDDARSLTHDEIRRVVPLVFAFIPETAIKSRASDLKIKPLVRKHLDALDIKYDDELVSIIKSIADQYYSTSNQNNLTKLRKYSMSDIRSLGAYPWLSERQKNRCAICGHNFRKHGGETLDHIIPWRLIGDNQDGSNWQILCATCNSGKSSYLTHLMLLASMNWVYGRSNLSDEEYSTQVRYSVLSRDCRCTFDSCDATPRNSALVLAKSIQSGLGLYDFLTTRCPKHLESSNPAWS
jgi:5-methylcytosine-specific restriction endonuclease McrA